VTTNLDATETPKPAETASSVRRGHRVWSTILIVVASILTPITIVALFVNTQLTDTNRYVQNVAPLSRNPAVQSFVADSISGSLIAAIDEHKYIASLLPKRAQPLIDPLRTAFEGFITATTLKVVQSDQFSTLWDQANRVAHTQINNVLTGKTSGKILTSTNGVVSIDVSAIVQRVVQALHDRGIDVFSRVPIVAVGRKIPIFQSKDLYKIRKAVNLFDKIAFLLPFLVFGCYGGAILLARDRRRAFLWSAVGFALGAIVLAIGLAIGRNVYLNAISGSEIPHDAAAAVFDTLLRFLHTSVRAAVSLSVVVVLAVFFAGPSRLSKGFRNRVHASVDWLGGESDEAGWSWLGPIGPIVRHKGAWRAAIAVVLFVLLFLWKHPTPMVIFWFGVVALLLLALIEYFGRERGATAAPTAIAAPD
jgi:hypothetical protein